MNFLTSDPGEPAIDDSANRSPRVERVFDASSRPNRCDDSSRRRRGDAAFRRRDAGSTSWRRGAGLSSADQGLAQETRYRRV